MSTSASALPVAQKGRLRKARKMLVLASRRRWRRALRHGVASAIEHRSVAFENSFATVIDVGAHHGQFALLARELFPDAKVICFEPFAESADMIERVFKGDDAVTVRRCALASEQATRVLHVSKASDSSSLLGIKKSYTDSFPGTEEEGTVEVEAVRLDEALMELSRPALLKIDAQGGEMEVLAGTGGLIDKIDSVFVECSFIEFYEGQALADDIIRELAGRGLRLSGVYSVVTNRANQCLQADLLFSRVGQ